MPVQWRLDALLEAINKQRRAHDLREITHRDLADASDLDVDSISRIARNVRVGQGWLERVDRLLTALSEFAGRRIEPGELIVKLTDKPNRPQKRATTEQAQAPRPRKRGQKGR